MKTKKMDLLGTVIFLLIILVLLPSPITAAECGCDRGEDGRVDKHRALLYKIAAIASILVAGAIGVCLPILGKVFPPLRPERDVFFVVKAFAAGVILSTGFIHILPDAFENLTSPCLPEHPWGKFPFTGLAAMATAIGTLMVDTFATAYFERAHFGAADRVSSGGGEKGAAEAGDHSGHVHVHTHATHGHAHGSTADPGADHLRHRVISQVLELGIVVHSVIIGISLGASSDPKEIKPLVAALSFHQFFEGMGLGGCISQAKFEGRAIAVMSLFFSLTTPVGIAIGMAISSRYDENSTAALIVEGAFNAAAAGILIYMALVDLLAADFMSPRMRGDLRLQLTCNASLLVGAGLMSLLAVWA